MAGTTRESENEQEKKEYFPLDPRKYRTPYQIQFVKEHKDMQVEDATRNQGLLSLATICEMRDFTDNPPQVRLQAGQAILNKVLPDKIGPRLDVQVDLVKLFEMYRSISTGKDQLSQEVKDK